MGLQVSEAQRDTQYTRVRVIAACSASAYDRQFYSFTVALQACKRITMNA